MRSSALFVLMLFGSLSLAGCADDATDPPGVTTPTGPPVTGTPIREDFEATEMGALPEGWRILRGNWSVETNASAPAGPRVLRQSGVEEGEPAILADKAGDWGDLRASVNFTVLAGESGQAGGIIFRHASEKSYYVVRYNEAEQYWNLFRTIDGKRQKFAGTDAAAAEFQGGLHRWIDLQLVAEGPRITVVSQGITVLDYTEEDPNAPIAGAIGLWARYDSQTQFDDFRVSE